MSRDRSLASDVVLGEDLDLLKRLCNVNGNGCWITPVPGCFACRARNDERFVEDLPSMKPHRWAWLVANGHSANPRAAASMVIKRNCGTKRCCNPCHLRATDPADAEPATTSKASNPLDSAAIHPVLGSTSPWASDGKSVEASASSGEHQNVAARGEAPTEAVPVQPLGPSHLLAFEDDLETMAELCTLTDKGCWVTSPSAVACRARGDVRPYDELPKMAAHRWTWMVANGYSSNPLPGSMFQVRRRCVNVRCCNPEHLYLTAPDGTELSVGEAETWLQSEQSRWQDAPGIEGGSLWRGQALVFEEDLDGMKLRCQLDDSGCWLAPSTGPVACRANLDTREHRELPKMAPHRWTWMIANGYASNPLPGNLFQVRRQCEKSKCCNPAHLYLTAPDGRELTLRDAEAWLPAYQPGLQDAQTVTPTDESSRSVAIIGEPFGREAQRSVPSEHLDVEGASPFDDLRPRSWLEAFPWLKGAAGADSLPWWNSSIDDADAETRHDFLGLISQLAMERLTRWTIGQIFPGLPPTLDLRLLPLPVRALNALHRERAVLAADLNGLALDDMMDWRQIGVYTVDLILQALADASTSGATPTVTSNWRSPLPAGSQAFDNWAPAPWSIALVNDLIQIAGWYTSIGLPGQSLFEGTLQPGTPPDVIEARHRLQRLTAHDVMAEGGTESDVAASFEEALGLLDSRAIQVLSQRLFADEPLTLDELGRRLDVTRERVRQIEGKARGALLTYVSEEGPLADVAQAARALIGTIRPLDDLLPLMPALGEQVESVGQPAWRVLDRLDDAYEILDGWCVVPTMTAARTMTQAQLQEQADKYGVVRLEDLDLIQADSPERRGELTASWLAQCGYIVDGECVLTRTNSVGDYAAAVLSLSSEPLSAEQIVDQFVIDRSVASLRNTMGTDDRFERVDRDRWALREWGLEAYAGIRSLIREQVAAASGAVPLNDLIESITSRYTVSASSITAYASSPPFELRDGVVRIGGAGREGRKTPDRTRHLFRRPDAWAYRVRITKEHLRGSGSVAPVAVASIVGLQYGDALQLPSPLGPQAITWKGTQPTLGTVRRFLLEHDVEAGAEAFLVFGDDRTFAFEAARPLTGDPLTDVLSLIGAPEILDSSLARAALATAVGLPATAPTSSLIGSYRERGDGDIADEITSIRDYLNTDQTAEQSSHTAEVDEILDLL
jgi:hypothetical protein